jgi:hypothetical protein
LLVLTYTASRRTTIKRVLIPTDFPRAPARASTEARSSEIGSAEAVLLYVIPRPIAAQHRPRRAVALAAEGSNGGARVNPALPAHRKASVMEASTPAGDSVVQTDEGADVIVMSATGTRSSGRSCSSEYPKVVGRVPVLVSGFQQGDRAELSEEDRRIGASRWRRRLRWVSRDAARERAAVC